MGTYLGQDRPLDIEAGASVERNTAIWIARGNDYRGDLGFEMDDLRLRVEDVVSGRVIRFSLWRGYPG